MQNFVNYKLCKLQTSLQVRFDQFVDRESSKRFPTRPLDGVAVAEHKQAVCACGPSPGARNANGTPALEHEEQQMERGKATVRRLTSCVSSFV